MHIADVQLNQGDTRALDGVMQGHTGVGVGPGVQNHPGQLAGVQCPASCNQSTSVPFVVALAKIQRKTIGGAGALTQGLHIVQRLRAIHLRLACAQQVEVGSVEDKHGFHIRVLSWKTDTICYIFLLLALIS
jgi:hypothetical protein